MLLAQAKELTDVTQRAIQSAEVYGLIGYLLVAVLIVIVMFTAAVLRFCAPRVSNFVESTVALHTSLKETNIKTTALLDSIKQDHGSKLSGIEDLIQKSQCKFMHPVPSAMPSTTKQPPNVTPVPHGA